MVAFSSCWLWNHVPTRYACWTTEAQSVLPALFPVKRVSFLIKKHILFHNIFIVQSHFLSKVQCEEKEGHCKISPYPTNNTETHLSSWIWTRIMTGSFTQEIWYLWKSSLEKKTFISYEISWVCVNFYKVRRLINTNLNW